MARHHHACGHPLCCLLLLLGLPRSAAEGFRNRSCLLNVTYNASERRNLSLGGVSQPLRIGVMNWASAKIEGWIFRIIVEEVLGVNVVVSVVPGGSREGFNDVARCKDPHTHAISGMHVAIGTWVGTSFLANAERMQRDDPSSMPIDLGSIGYDASDGLFLREAIFQEALQQSNLFLDFYRGYSHPDFDARRYFDDPWSIDLGTLKSCNESWMKNVKAYFRASNDTEGVTVTHGPDGAAYAARCTQGKWWLSPSCRVNSSRCVPVITGGSGWDLDAIMQRTTAWGIPAAVGVAKDFAAYLDLPWRYRMLFYWWFPDSSFVTMQLKRLIWPFHDSLEYSQGIRTSQARAYPIHNWACAALENRSNAGASKPLAVLRSMKLLQHEIAKLVKDKTELAGDSDAGIEPVVCEWLNNNADRALSWIPLSTACASQQGLVDHDGAFVDTRQEAQDCAWCVPGRMSVPVLDVQGNTYRCAPCEKGTFQKLLGTTACERCAEGRFAAERGQSSCQNCAHGEYASRLGQSECDACPPTFITDLRGATRPEACICPAGSYLGEDQRDACEPCPEGMTCPEGSDMRGYSPEHAAQHPVVPLLKPGFWSSGEEPMSIFRCDDAVRCPGATVPGRACADKFELQGCAACQEGHVQSGSTCVPCPSGAAQILLFPVLPLVVVVVLVAVLYRSTGGPYTTWDSCQKGVSSAVFILLNHYHVINIIRGLDVISERSLSSTFQYIGVLSDMLGIFRPQCSGVRSFKGQLVLNSHGPGVLLLVFLVLWLSSQLLGLCSPRLRMDRNRLLNSYLSLILTFFTTVVDMAFTIFKCSDNPSGVHTLVRDKSITCYQGEWNQMVVIGVLAILFWCVGFGAAVLRAIYVASRWFHDEAFRTRWTFLFVRYRPDVHWWSMTIVARGALLNSGLFVMELGNGQIYWILSVLILYTQALFIFRPWRHLLNNSMDSFAHVNLALTCALAIWLARDSVRNVAEETATAVLLMKVNMALAAAPFIPLAALMMWRARSRRAQERKDTDSKLILNAFSLMFEGTAEAQLDFLKRLTEHDFQLMCEVKSMLLMEHGHKKVRPGYSASHLSTLSKKSLDVRTVAATMSRLWSAGKISVRCEAEESNHRATTGFSEPEGPNPRTGTASVESETWNIDSALAGTGSAESEAWNIDDVLAGAAEVDSSKPVQGDTKSVYSM